jgi:hypothetical protein
MTTGRRRLVLDRTFDQAIDTVLSAFLGEGFAVKPIDGGDLHERATGRLRYALLEATLPELMFVPTRRSEGVPALLGCQISIFELAGSCTMITASSHLGRYPLLASLVPRLDDRVNGALTQVACQGATLVDPLKAKDEAA